MYGLHVPEKATFCCGLRQKSSGIEPVLHRLCAKGTGKSAWLEVPSLARCVMGGGVWGRPRPPFFFFPLSALAWGPFSGPVRFGARAVKSASQSRNPAVQSSSKSPSIGTLQRYCSLSACGGG